MSISSPFGMVKLKHSQWCLALVSLKTEHLNHAKDWMRLVCERDEHTTEELVLHYACLHVPILIKKNLHTRTSGRNFKV